MEDTSQRARGGGAPNVHEMMVMTTRRSSLNGKTLNGNVALVTIVEGSPVHRADRFINLGGGPPNHQKPPPAIVVVRITVRVFRHPSRL